MIEAGAALTRAAMAATADNLTSILRFGSATGVNLSKIQGAGDALFSIPKIIAHARIHRHGWGCTALAWKRKPGARFAGNCQAHFDDGNMCIHALAN